MTITVASLLGMSLKQASDAELGVGATLSVDVEQPLTELAEAFDASTSFHDTLALRQSSSRHLAMVPISVVAATAIRVATAAAESKGLELSIAGWLGRTRTHWCTVGHFYNGAKPCPDHPGAE